MRIGELAQHSGISRDAPRYYEKAGLLPAVPRTDNRYRDYPADTLRRLTFIRTLQSLGFTLSGVRDLLAAVDRRGPKCRTVGPNIKQTLGELDRQIAALTQTRRELVDFFSECRPIAGTRTCTPLARILPAPPRVQRHRIDS